MKRVIRRLFVHLILLLLLTPLYCSAQSGTWIWMGGHRGTPGGTPVFGIKGVEDSANTPGSFYGDTHWTDLNGNFWLLNEPNLWRLNPATGYWAWINGPGSGTGSIGYPEYGTKGVPSVNNRPGTRAYGCPNWTDNNGDLWLYAGENFGGTRTVGDGEYDDLWRYHIATNEWTWIAGDSAHDEQPPTYGTLMQEDAANTPGERNICSAAWVDANNNLWLFGDADGYDFNDMWRFNTTTLQWAWMKGPQGGNAQSHYGTPGVEDALNLPHGRQSYTKWKDAAGNFYLFGSTDYASGNAYQEYSDVWKFNPVSNNWTWVAGDAVPNSNGNYQQYCSNNGSTGPMARQQNATAYLLSGCKSVYYVFGGFTYNVHPFRADGLNDLWMFDPASNQWKWLSGPPTVNDPGNYGVKRVAAASNMPPERGGACLWVDNSGALWVFGGMDSTGGYVYNDLWKYIPDSSCSLIASSSINLSNTTTATSCGQVNGAASVTVTAGTGPFTYYWNTGATTASITGLNNGTYTVTVSNTGGCPATTSVFVDSSAGIGLSAYGTRAGCTNSGMATVNVTTGTGPFTYVWSNGQTTTSINSLWPGSYAVTVTGAGGCSASALATVVSTGTSVTLQVSAAPAVCNANSGMISVTATAGNGPFNYAWSNGAVTDTALNLAAGTYIVTVTSHDGCTATATGVVNTTGTDAVTVTAVGDTLKASNAAAYQWYLNNAPIPGATSGIYIATTNGTYYVQANDANGCVTISNTQIVNNTVGIIETETADGVNVYPNPLSDGGWHIAVSNRWLGGICCIYDALGRLVYKTEISQNHIDVQLNVVRGLYLMRINTNGVSCGVKLIKL